MSVARAHLDALFHRIDAFFHRVEERYSGPGGVTCHAGCADCCKRRFSVTAIEAEVMSEGLRLLDAEARRTLAERAAHGDPEACPALEADGRCAIYAVRPVICRTHGLPIRFSASARSEAPEVDPPVRRLPVVIDACPENFSGDDLDELAADCVLDQTTISTVLGAIDSAFAAERGRARGERIAIAELLASDR